MRRPLALILALHLPAAAAWWWLMPRGWPISSSRFWVNQVTPIVMMLVATLAIVGLITKREKLTMGLGLLLASLWLAASIVAVFVFPISGWLISIRLAPLAVLMFVTLRPLRRSLRAWHALPVLLGAAMGSLVILAERGPRATTTPLAVQIPQLAPDTNYESQSIPVGKFTHFSARSADLQITSGPLLIEITSLLTFTSCSPDAGWVNFASPKDRTPPRRSLDRIAHDTNAVTASYSPPEVLRVTPDNPHDAVGVEAFSPVDHPTYSHLNTFCELSISGHKRLSIAFSPCPDTKIDVTYFDYPFGRPATFACLGADGVFRILRASNSEKGPFTEIASGPLKRGEPLTLTLFDQDIPHTRLAFDDWSAQLSTEPSPTAGWNIPVNAIEFSLMYDNPTSPAGIYMTLAATSVGRGFDSVGHAPGVYRNRMRVEQIQHD